MAISRAQMNRQLYAGGGVSSLQAARDMLQSQALPGEFLAYINPEEAMMLKAMGGAGEPINQSGIPSFFVKKVFKSAKKLVSSATDAVTDFAKSDIGQIALAVAAPYALGPAFASMGLAGSVGGSAFLGNALRAGITNLALQGVTTGKFNLGQALKTGAVGGAITTGLQGQNFLPKGTKVKPGQVTEGGTILGSPVTDDTVLYDFDGMTAADFAAPEVAATAPTFRESMADINLQRGISQPTITTPATPKFTTDFDPARFADNSYITLDTPSAQVAQVGGDASIAEQIAAQNRATALKPSSSFGVANAATPDSKLIIPQAKPTGLETTSTFKDLVDTDVLYEDFPETVIFKQKAIDALKDVAGTKELAAIRDAEGFTETTKAIFKYAKENPTAVIGSVSLMSALTAPKQPDETDFDYEARLKYVNELASEYGDLAGVDMSTLGLDTDFYSRYKERAGVAMGGIPEIPMGEPRQNAGGITELDYRDTGGFVPVGIKEKADDVPAMLSKNEFVFTADAVRNAGNGDVDKGAQKLYNVMKTLENGGTV
jgi:hypothetical protein